MMLIQVIVVLSALLLAFGFCLKKASEHKIADDAARWILFALVFFIGIICFGSFTFDVVQMLQG